MSVTHCSDNSTGTLNPTDKELDDTGGCDIIISTGQNAMSLSANAQKNTNTSVWVSQIAQSKPGNYAWCQISDDHWGAETFQGGRRGVAR